MSSLIEKINEVTANVKNRHSFFQLQYFVIGQEPTTQAKIQACKRELVARKTSIESLLLNIAELYDQQELRLLEIKKLQKFETDELYDKEEIDIKVRQTKRKIRNLEDQIREHKEKLTGFEEEANFLIGLYNKYSEMEKPQDFYSLQIQAEYWNAKLNKDLEARLLLGHTPDPETIKLILSLPDGMPVKAQTQKLIEVVQTTAKKQLES